MKRMAWMLAALVAVLTTAACGSSNDTPTCNTASPVYTPAQGTWAMCAPTGAGGTAPSMKNTITVSGCGVTILNDVYATTADCSGTAIRAAAGAGTITFGAAVPNTGFNTAATPVTAYQLDVLGTITPTGGSAQALGMYTLGYVNGTTLYMGDTSGANDGTTAAKRPTVLDGYFPFTKIP
jgi:hypothetical protein